MSEFRETLAHALGDGDGMARFEPDYIAADKVLAMPEMQAIRQDLRDKYARWVKAQWVFQPTALSSDLPESIEKWIMEEES